MVVDDNASESIAPTLFSDEAHTSVVTDAAPPAAGTWTGTYELEWHMVDLNPAVIN